MASIVVFPDASAAAPVPALGQVGGKGMSLWRMSGVPGVTVPNGFVLTTAFFEEWFRKLAAQPCWKAMLDACKRYSPDDQRSIESLHAACAASKEVSRRFELEEGQRQLVMDAMSSMATSAQGPTRFVAVRSSSPEEDLAGMSFAGGYETQLGVPADQFQAVQQAVSRVFASCLDERVFVYKLSHGVADLTPKIAIVVQRQVAAQVAGVAFSLDPISNCYDWATINTNFGLGESVVSGQCSPDYYLVQKHKPCGAVLKSELGKKLMAMWLGEDGGVHEKAAGDSSSQWTLTADEVRTVTQQLLALENFYGHPVDTEFALDERRQLMWLQARPVTTHFDLPQQVLTPTGSQEVIWLDVMQIVQGFTNRLSTTGLSFIRQLFAQGVLREVLGLKEERATMHNRPFIVVPESGIAYCNASFIMKLIGWKRKDSWCNMIELMDFSVAKTIRELDSFAPYDSANLVLLPLNLAINSPGMLCNLKNSARQQAEAVRRAQDAHAGIWGICRDLLRMRGHPCAEQGAFQVAARSSNTKEWFAGSVIFPPTADLVAAQLRKSGRGAEGTAHVLDLVRAVLPTIVRGMFNGLVASTASGGFAQKNINAMFATAPPDVKALVDDVTSGSSFVTTVLSDLLDEMADALLEAGGQHTLEELVAAVKGTGPGLPAKADAIWRTVMEQFGHRGVGELDASCPRYREEPEMLLEQVIAFMGMERAMRPKGLAATAEEKRTVAIQRLGAWLEERRLDKAAFTKEAERYHSHFCFRESGKYLIIKLVDFVRLEVLKQAQGFLNAGHIDDLKDVWFLTLEDLRDIHYDGSIDVRALVKQRREMAGRNAHVKRWPKVVTSRGRELRAKPREAKEGEVAGHAVAPGVVQGRIKCLQTPREKPLHTGEILVAKATDPGWTPLFVPAAGVLLEVGGALQHGALVAREFGKPCVAGIDDIMHQFQDGMLVEVDGTEGIVKILEKE